MNTIITLATYQKPSMAFNAMSAIEFALHDTPAENRATLRVAITGVVQTWGGDLITLDGSEPVSPCNDPALNGWWATVIDHDGVSKTVADAVPASASRGKVVIAVVADSTKTD